MASAAMLAAVGCKVGPNYHAPKTRVRAGFYEPTTRPNTQPTTAPAIVDLTHWWQTFNDPTLDRLIDEGIRQNLDIALAQARVREARSQLQSSTAGLFPTVDATGGYTHARTSQSGRGSVATSNNNGTGGTGSNGGTNAISSGSAEADLYQAGFDAGWELDVFGGTRRAIEAAQASLDALIEARRSTLVTLLSEIAQNYVILRGAQHELAIVRQNVEAQRNSLGLQQAKLRAGIATDLTVAQAEALLASTESELPTLEQNIHQTIQRLSVLLNRDPNALADELTFRDQVPSGPPVVPPGLPSDLLRRRPDIRQSERQLAAATANIGVATADFFPRFSLTGSFGVASGQLKTLFNSSSAFYSVGPAVRWNLFDAGVIRANIGIQNALQEQAYITYQQTVLQALSDVENALIAYEREQARRTSLQRSVTANRRALDLAYQLYNNGVVDFLNVLTAQQSLYQSQNELAQSDQIVTTNLVALYKALGGGWESAEATIESVGDASALTPSMANDQRQVSVPNSGEVIVNRPPPQK